MLKKLCIGFLTVFTVMCFVSISWGYGTTYYSFNVCGTKSFKINPGRNEITFSPNQAGSWWFKAYLTSIYAGVNYVAVFLHWKDTSNPNDYWHYWTGLDAYYYFSLPPGRILLYGGTSSIAYKFVVSNYNNFPVDLSVNIE